MDQVLSQEEIDALLSGLSDGAIEIEQKAEPDEPKQEVRTFDILQFTKSKKENLPALQFIYDRFSKSFQSALSLFLGRDVEIEQTPVHYIEYREFVKTLPLPTNMNVITTENLNGFFIVVFDAKIVFCALESVFGGSDVSAPRIEGREFTKIELYVIKKLADIFSNEMEKAWTPVYRITCKYSRSEMNPNYVTMVSQEEIVSICQFSFNIENVSGWMKICIPYGILETIKDYLTSTPSREGLEMRHKWIEKMKEEVMNVPLDIRVTLGKKRISLKDFLGAKEDTIIMVDRSVNDPVDIMIGGKAKLKGRLGILKGSKAVQIEGTI